MFNASTPINASHDGGLVKESGQLPSSSAHEFHLVCKSHAAEGKYMQRDPANRNATQVYCDACIIQFYHRSNTFLANLNMKSQQTPNQQGANFALVGQQTIDNFNNSLMHVEQPLSSAAFLMSCVSNCIERNKEIALQQEISKKETLYYLQNMQQNNSVNAHNIGKQRPHLQQLYSVNSTPSVYSGLRNEFQQIPSSLQGGQGSFVTSNIQGCNAPSSFDLQQQNLCHSSNQLNFGNGRLHHMASEASKFNYASSGQLMKYQQINALDSRYNNPSSMAYSHGYTSHFDQMNQGNASQNQYSNIEKQVSGLVTPNTFFSQPRGETSIQNASNQLTFSNELQQQMYTQNSMNPTPNFQQQAPFITINNTTSSYIQNPQVQNNQYQACYDQNYGSAQVNCNGLQGNEIVFASHHQQNGHQLNKFSTPNVDINCNLQENSGLLVESQNPIIPININNTSNSNGNNSICASAQFGQFGEEERKTILKSTGLKKASQKIKHANKFGSNKQTFDIILENVQEIGEVTLGYVNQDYLNQEEILEEEEMKIILDHEYQQELHSKKRRGGTAKKTSEQEIVSHGYNNKSGKKLGSQKSSQSLVIGKSKEIEKKKQDRSKKSSSIVFSSSWCPQSQQLLFEWNNTPLKQISFQSDKIVNESVNVASYVNILNKNRIMIISQNTNSLKYQINLIDLQENRVICKNQLGQNFQLFPFEPTKLKVQTVKISERLSCIYLMGGSYFKIIKNATLRNVKRVKQHCIQQILPINKGRQVVALSLNGLINIYSTTNDRFHLIQSMKIKRESPFSISYVNYFDVDTENSLIYCCVLSSHSQFIQIFNMFTGEIIYSQDIHILQQNQQYKITNMKIFQNHLYIELQLRQDEHHAGEQPVQFKVQAYKIDNQSHHLNEFKTYNHSNILKSSFSTKQFFLYNSQKSCIIGFEKLNQKKSKHYLTSSDEIFVPQTQVCENDNLSPSHNISSSNATREENIMNPSQSSDVYQKIFKLNIKQTSPKYRPVFTHIFKEIPHEHLNGKSGKFTPSIFDHFPQFSATVSNATDPTMIGTSDNLDANSDSLDMVLTLFDQNKNVYKIYQN